MPRHVDIDRIRVDTSKLKPLIDVARTRDGCVVYFEAINQYMVLPKNPVKALECGGKIVWPEE